MLKQSDSRRRGAAALILFSVGPSAQTQSYFQASSAQKAQLLATRRSLRLLGFGSVTLAFEYSRFSLFVCFPACIRGQAAGSLVVYSSAESSLRPVWLSAAQDFK